MRQWLKQRQKIWFVERTKVLNGIDTIYEYGKPIERKCGVSYSSISPEELAVGVNPDYDRYITIYGTNFLPEEGSLCFVDVTPELDSDGNLAMDANGIEPVTAPDYIVKRILSKQKGSITRFGIVKRDGDSE